MLWKMTSFQILTIFSKSKVEGVQYNSNLQGEVHNVYMGTEKLDVARWAIFIVLLSLCVDNHICCQSSGSARMKKKPISTLCDFAQDTGHWSRSDSY